MSNNDSNIPLLTDLKKEIEILKQKVKELQQAVDRLECKTLDSSEFYGVPRSQNW
jgi:hypothetical protein